jgi:hypothetical protein
MERPRGRRRELERPAGPEREADLAREEVGEKKIDDDQLGQALLRAARQRQLDQALGELAVQGEVEPPLERPLPRGPRKAGAGPR